jgi:acetyl-CoA synthetase
VKDVSYDAANFHIRWYEDGQLNVAANCLDRHLATRGDKTAILWEGDDPGQSTRITYRELHQKVSAARQRAQGRSACRRATASRSTCR